MKKILLLLFVSATLSQVFAIAGAAPTVNANRYTELVTAKGTGWDTLSGVDSAVFCSKIPLPTGSAFILNRAAITGTGADSVLAQVVVDAYDVNGKFLYRSAVDTFTTASSVCPGEQIAIPFYDTIFGDLFTIKIISTSGAGAGGQQILNSMRLYVRKLYDGWHQYTGN